MLIVTLPEPILITLGSGMLEWVGHENDNINNNNKNKQQQQQNQQQQ